MTTPNYTDPLQKSPGTGAGDTRNAVREASQAAKDQASAMWKDTKSTAKSALGEQQKAAAGGIGDLAGALRKAAREMEGGREAPVSRMIESAADGLERLSGALRERDVNGMMRDVESFARRQPVAFFGAAALVGFLAVRFLKSSNRQDESYGSGTGAGYGGAGYGSSSGAGYGAGYGTRDDTPYGASRTDQQTPF